MNFNIILILFFLPICLIACIISIRNIKLSLNYYRDHELFQYLTIPLIAFAVSGVLYNFGVSFLFLSLVLTRNFSTNLVAFRILLIIVSLFAIILTLGLRSYLVYSVKLEVRSLAQYRATWVVLIVASLVFITSVIVFLQRDSESYPLIMSLTILGGGLGLIAFSIYRFNIYKEIIFSKSALVKARLDMMISFVDHYIFWFIYSLILGISLLYVGNEWLVSICVNGYYGILTILTYKYYKWIFHIPEDIREKYNITSSRYQKSFNP